MKLLFIQEMVAPNNNYGNPRKLVMTTSISIMDNKTLTVTETIDIGYRSTLQAVEETFGSTSVKAYDQIKQLPTIYISPKEYKRLLKEF